VPESNAMQIFNHNEFGEIRGFEQDGKPWFVGKDIATVLGYYDTDKAIRTHCKSHVKAAGTC